GPSASTVPSRPYRRQPHPRPKVGHIKCMVAFKQSDTSVFLAMPLLRKFLVTYIAAQNSYWLRKAIIGKQEAKREVPIKLELTR
ncbi:MAG: hypothetical protein WBH86_04020, partial [Thermogutta sp.]